MRRPADLVVYLAFAAVGIVTTVVGIGELMAGHHDVVVCGILACAGVVMTATAVTGAVEEMRS